MGWSFDIPWWGVVLIFLYLFAIRFGIGAILGGLACYVLLSISKETGKIHEGESTRIPFLLLCGLPGGLVNYGIMTTFS